MPTYEYECGSCGVVEIFHAMSDAVKIECPECGKKGLERLISGGAAVIMKGREANQYNDIKAAKYWRDRDGIRHRVGPGDGNSKSPTASRKRRHTDEQIAAIKKRDKQLDKKRREQTSYAASKRQRRGSR